MDVREKTKQKINDTISDSGLVWWVSDIEVLTESIMVGLDELLEEGFVPDPETTPVGKMLFDSTITEIPNAPVCPDCNGLGAHTTDPLFGDIPHTDVCTTCDGEGFV